MKYIWFLKKSLVEKKNTTKNENFHQSSVFITPIIVDNNATLPPDCLDARQYMLHMASVQGTEPRGRLVQLCGWSSEPPCAPSTCPQKSTRAAVVEPGADWARHQKRSGCFPVTSPKLCGWSSSYSSSCSCSISSSYSSSCSTSSFYSSSCSCSSLKFLVHQLV